MQQIKKILCATDLSKFSDCLLFQGVELSLKFGASLSIFHSIPPPRGSVTDQIEFERGGEKNERIKAAHVKIKTMMHRFDIQWDAIVTYGDPIPEAAQLAKKITPDIVIAASHGLSGFQHFFMGSVLGDMAQTIRHPLLVMPPGKPTSDTCCSNLEVNNIIIACSLTEADESLKQYALAFSEKFKSKIGLVYVMESPLNEAVVESLSAPYDNVQKQLEHRLILKLKKIMPAETAILRGVPGEELMLYTKSHETDLIIAGVDDRPGRIITTTTAALLRQLPCAVLTVPINHRG